MTRLDCDIACKREYDCVQSVYVLLPILPVRCDVPQSLKGKMQRLNKKGLLSEGELVYNATFSGILKVHLEADNCILNPQSQGLMNVLEIKLESPGPLA